MKVCAVESVGIAANGPDTLAAANLVAGTNSYLIEMCIDRTNHLPFIVFIEDVFDHNHITPALTEVLRFDDTTIGNCNNILPKIGILPSRAVPLLAGMNPQIVLLGKMGSDIPAAVAPSGSLVGVYPGAIAITEWEIETIGRGKGCFQKCIEDIRWLRDFGGSFRL
jgi:hypothetical protein